MYVRNIDTIHIYIYIYIYIYMCVYMDTLLALQACLIYALKPKGTCRV